MGTRPSKMREKVRRRHALAAITCALVAYGVVVIRDFSGPIGDFGESFLFEYLSYYVSKNLTFDPLPHLGLVNDQVFFPYGTNQALQSFCVERDLLYTLLARVFGTGPWLQLYYLGGIAVAAYGTFALLERDHGPTRAAICGIAASCLNFYGAEKYPHHHNISCVHWVTLAIVCDFVIFERVVERRRVSIVLLLVRALLFVLGFGLELGHVVGYGLTSLSITGVFVLALVAVREARRRRGSDPEPSAIARWVAGAREELRAKRVLIVGLATATLLVGILYGSIVVDILAAASVFGFKHVPLGVWWTHPIRLLIPYFPWMHPSQKPRFEQVWGDTTEDLIGGGSAGWALLGLAIVGLLHARRRLRYAPLALLFFLFVVSRPTFDLIRWMPWFKFTRVFTRATVIYSTVLALFALGVSRERLVPWSRRPLAAAFGLIAALELYTFASIKSTHAAYAFDDEFLRYMGKIAELPGQAVLDFPFCVVGGNGDLAFLCPYTERLKSQHALQRFHHKKVVGQYLGRLHPSQTRSFQEQGWPKMWDPDSSDPTKANRQVRCLNDAEWEFLAAFFLKNDFSGIQVAIDRLPEGCPEEIYARFGKPIGEVTIVRAGRLAFIPRDPRTRDQLDPEGGKRVRLVVPLADSVELVSGRHRPMVDEWGLSNYEWLGSADDPESKWRWAMGEYTELRFELTGPREVAGEARFRTPLVGQIVTIELDDQPVDKWIDIDPTALNARSFRAGAGAGRHTLRFRFALSNSGRAAWAPDDPRPMTIMLESLVLRADPPRN